MNTPVRPKLRPAGLVNRQYHDGIGSGPFMYPQEDNSDYKGKITFTANKFESKTLGEVADSLTGIGDLLETADEAIQGEGEGQKFAFKGGDKKSVQPDLPKRIGNGRRATLFLPGGIQFADNVSYTNFDLGIIGAGAAAGIRSGASAGDLIAGAVGSVINNFRDLSTAFQSLSGETAQVAALRVARKLNSEIQGAIETTTGITINPNKRASLQGPQLRTFRFTFKLIPLSQREAQEIKNIVTFFREEMYPDVNDVEGISTAQRFPSKFDIKMSYDGYRVATGILPCFLTNVDVVYNPNSMAWHSDGNPQETDISLSFIEERTLTKRDIITGEY